MDSKPITLTGSAERITEFFGYALNNILYQRAVYPAEEFVQKSKYGLGLWLTNNRDLGAYIDNILAQVQKWLNTGDCQRLVLVMAGVDTKKNLERWDFHIDSRIETENGNLAASGKTDAQVVQQIQGIMRQILSSVSFLPLSYNEEISCEILVHTSKVEARPTLTTQGTEVPLAWEESMPRLIEHAQHVQLRQVDTGYHKVSPLVSYEFNENVV